MPLLRSNVEFAKRVFLDRLTTDAQPMLQPNPGSIDEGPGDDYDYGGCYDPFNFGVGADCSGADGIFIGAAIFGPGGMSWTRQFTTEDFPGSFQGFRQTTQQDLLNNYYPIKVCIGNHGGGEDSHMHIELDGVAMESNGDYGTCTLGHGAMTNEDPYWNNWFVYDGAIVEDTTYRCPMSYPRGYDYAGGRVSGASLRSAGVAFVFRYFSDGGSDLPDKRITGAEFADLAANGIQIGINWETTATMMLAGYAQGVADAQACLAWYQAVSGIVTLTSEAFYFSADFDEAQSQDQAIWDYLDGATSVLGLRPDGKRRAALYGSYYVCKRAADAGKVDFFWQTEAWSDGDDGYNIDSRVAVIQRNNVGYQTVDGVQCDVNEAHTDDFGQYIPPGVAMQEDTDNLILDQLAGPLKPDGTRGWDQLGGLSVVDFLGKTLFPAIQQLQITLTSIQSKGSNT